MERAVRSIGYAVEKTSEGNTRKSGSEYALEWKGRITAVTSVTVLGLSFA
jgi:hypothetical protein